MSMTDDEHVALEDKELLLQISHSFIVYYETYTDKPGNRIKYKDSTKMLFDNDKFLFGRFTLHLLSVFDVEATHLTLKEFSAFPKVADVIAYIYDAKK